MKRRDFIAKGTTGAIATGLAGCSGIGLGKVDLREELPPLEFDRKVPKPKGTMPMAEIGATGIKVSKFGFGSHMNKELVKYEKKREWMIREAVDLGINLFDVYDYEFQIFQYEPTGRYLAPVINDVVISITTWPFEGRTVEQQLERDLRLFGRDYIDLVRIHAWKNTQDEAGLKNQVGHRWEWWEKLFKLKEKGYIRAVGVPIHVREDLEQPLAELPIDFVIFPHNFYHNWTWSAKEPTKWDSTIAKLREKGIGIISMKPFGGDRLATPFKRLAAQYDESGSVNFAKACMRYIINSRLNVDSTLAGMYYPYHVYENVDAYFNPEFSDEERMVLKKIRNSARIISKQLLPEHYQFLEDWVPDSWDDSDLYGTV
jgi:predicted aldo/keto reductase-like oxidoreductase